MEFLNLTPHTLNVWDHGSKKEVLTLPVSGKVARVAVKNILVQEIAGVPIFTKTTGEVMELPAEKPDVLIVVSGIVKSAMPGRKDLLSPGQLLRNAEGQPVGCIGLVK